MAEFAASYRYARISPQKVTEVLRLIKGLPINDALEVLRFTPKRAAHMINKVVRSAMANAGERTEVDVDSLYIAEARVDQGPKLRRFRARARGAAYPIRKRMSHIKVVLAEGEKK